MEGDQEWATSKEDKGALRRKTKALATHAPHTHKGKNEGVKTKRKRQKSRTSKDQKEESEEIAPARTTRKKKLKA